MKKGKKILEVLLIIFVVFMCSSSITLAETEKCASAFNVLIINSYHIGHYWESYVIEGFREAAEAYNQNEINIKVEYFDFRSRNDEKYIASFLEFIEMKYPKGSIDAIYTIDDEAFSVISPQITNEYSELYHVPLVFSGVDSNISFTEEQKKYITGIYQRDVTLEGFNLILQMDDTIDCINIITESSGFGNNLIGKSTNIVTEHLGNEIELNIIQSDYIEDIEIKLKEYQSTRDNDDKKEVILLGGEFQYKDTGAFLDPKRSVEIIKEYLPWPIYTNDPTYIYADILGGCMDIGQLQGKEIFDRVKRMVEGEDVSDIESTFAPDPKWILKYDEIYKYNINIRNIPRKCIIIDKAFYQLLLPSCIKKVICVVLICIFILIVFLVHKIISMIKRIKKKEREREIEIAREKMQTDFIVNISHELRTPINIILSGISLVKMQLNKGYNELDNKYLEEKLNIINQNAYRLLKLANNIIDVKEIESGVIKLNKKNVNIVEIVEAIFTETIDYASKKNINMIFDTYEEEIVVSVDIEIIQRIVLNILSNAIKFTPDGGTIYTNVKNDNNYIIIEIIDTGIGIPKEKLETIFYRFYQVDNSLSRVNEGSGIGLSIAKELVELHDGKIEVESQLEKSTTVRVFLPAIYDDKANNIIFNENINKAISTAISTEMADVLK